MSNREALKPPPRKRSRLTRHISAFSGFKFYLGYLDISVILNLFQNPVTKKLKGKRIRSVRNNRNVGNASLIPPYVLTGGEKPENQVVYSNVIAHLLRNLEYVLKKSRNMCAMTGLNILSLALWGEGVVGCQSNVPHEIDCHPELVSGSHKILKHRNQSYVQKMLKRVQHDQNNFQKRTYSLIHLFTYSLIHLFTSQKSSVYAGGSFNNIRHHWCCCCIDYACTNWKL